MTRRSLVLAMFVLSVPAIAGAQTTVYWSDRPIAMPKGQQEVNIDLSVGLNRGALGEDFGLGSGLGGDRYSGLHFRAGMFKNFEIGLALQFLYSMHKGYNYLERDPIPVAEGSVGRFSSVDAATSDRRPPRMNPGPEGDGTHRMAGYPYQLGENGQSHLNPLSIYARYEIIPQLGVELGLIVPIEQRTGLNRPTIRVGVPFQYVLSPGLLSIHARPDFLVGFAKTGDGPDEPKDTAKLSFFVDAGVTLCLVGLFMDVSVGYGGDVLPYRRGYLPLTFLLGYTIFHNWDLYAGVTLENLLPESGKPDDARRLTLGTSVRF